MAASHLRTQLAALDAAIAAFDSHDVESYTLEGRSVTRADLGSMLDQREKLVAAIARAEAAESGKRNRRVYGRPGRF